MKDFKKSIELDPDKCRYKISVALNWLHRRDGKKAVDYLEELRVKYPSNITIFINLSTAYSMIGNYRTSIDFGKKVLEKLPNNWPCLFNLADAYYRSDRLEDYENTLSIFDRIMDDRRFKESDILRYEIYVKIALIMTRLKFFDEAINTYIRAYELCSSVTDKARIDFELGNLYFDNRKYPEAIAHYQKANNVFKEDIVRQYLAEAEEMKQNPEAIPASREHLDMPVMTILPDGLDGFKCKLEEELELKLCRVRNRNIAYSQDLKAYPLLRDEVNKRNIKLYQLFKGKDGLWYQRGLHHRSTRVAKVAITGQYTFVVQENIGDNPPMIIIGKVGHFYLSKQKEVLFAGEIVIKDGRIGVWDNGSGHFEPKAHSAEAVASATGLPLEKFFSLENITRLLKGLYAKYENIEKMAMSYDMRDLAFGDVNLVRSLRHYYT